MDDSASKRLVLFREKLGLKPAELAHALGFKRANIAQVESGMRDPSMKIVQALADKFSVHPSWLLYGKGPMHFDPEPAVQPPPSKDFEVGSLPGYTGNGGFTVNEKPFGLVRRFDVDASAGPGIFVESEEVIDQVAFSGEWLRKHDLKPDDAGIVRAKGISMEPIIPDGASMVVKFDISQPYQDGIYIFRRDGELFVKRCSVLGVDLANRPERVLISSPSLANHPDIVEIKDPDSFVFLARVVSVHTDV